MRSCAVLHRAFHPRIRRIRGLTPRGLRIHPAGAPKSARNRSVKGSKRQPDVVFAPVMRSRSMRRLDDMLKAVATKDVVIALIGESGTGKEILARRVHELSD